MTVRRHNLFLALQPTAAAAASIGRLMDRVHREHGRGVRIIRRQCLHISLVGLGDRDDLSASLIEKAKIALSTVTMPSFVVALNRLLSWKARAGQRPLVLEGDEGVIGVNMLCAQIDAALAAAGLKPPPVRKMIPHLTLGYGALDLPEEIVVPVSWRVQEFVLVESLVGEGHHVVLHRWPLVTTDTALSGAPSST